MFRLAGISAAALAVGVAAPTTAAASADAAACLSTLDRLGVKYERVERPGIAVGVRIEEELGGVKYQAYQGDDLVIDCSLAYSLARAAEILRVHGIDRAIYSGAYNRRKIRNTNRPSSHSFGLAIDIHVYEGDQLGRLRLKDDYEQGLGSSERCLGRPLTEGGAILRDVHCRLEEAKLFRYILSPDYDAHHFNHFHFEAAPWSEREDLP